MSPSISKCCKFSTFHLILYKQKKLHCMQTFSRFFWRVFFESQWRHFAKEQISQAEYNFNNTQNMWLAFNFLFIIHCNVRKQPQRTSSKSVFFESHARKPRQEQFFLTEDNFNDMWKAMYFSKIHLRYFRNKKCLQSINLMKVIKI